MTVALDCLLSHHSVTTVRAFESPGEYFLHILSNWCLREAMVANRDSNPEWSTYLKVPLFCDEIELRR